MTIVLRGITWEHARGYGSVVAAAEAYRSVRPEVEVRWDYRSLQAFADHPIDDLVQRYDLLIIDHPHVPLAAERELFAPLDGQGHDDELAVLAAQSVGRSHESYFHAGHQWGLATDAAAQVAVFRPDLIADPPRDWPAVLELAREGRVLWPAKPIDAFSSLVTVAANAGNPPMTQPGDFLGESEALAALDLLHDLAAAVPESNLGWNPIQVADALTRSDQWVYSPLLFGYTNYSRTGFRAHRLRYIDIPAGPPGVAASLDGSASFDGVVPLGGSASLGVSGSLLGGAGIAISAGTPHLSAALDHAFWLASADVQTGVYFDGGGQPGNAVSWDDDRTNAVTLDFFRGTRATLEGAYLRPRHARYIELQDALSPLVTRALAGELTDHEVITRMNDTAARLLAPR